VILCQENFQFDVNGCISIQARKFVYSCKFYDPKQDAMKLDLLVGSMIQLLKINFSLVKKPGIHSSFVQTSIPRPSSFHASHFLLRGTFVALFNGILFVIFNGFFPAGVVERILGKRRFSL